MHDVAAIQAALANIKRPGGSAPFWTNSIDGKASVLLHKTFNEFQIAADIKPTGGLHRGEETEKALIAALPQELKRMRGVEGLPVAFVSGAGNPPTVPFTRLPDDMREAIKPVAKAVENTLGLPLVLREPPQDKVAHIAVRIGVGNGVFLDGQGRTMPLDRAPEAVKLVIEKALQADPRLNLDSNAAPGRLVLTMQADGKLMLESHQKAIEGPQYPTLAELGTTCALVTSREATRRVSCRQVCRPLVGGQDIVAGAMFSGEVWARLRVCRDIRVARKRVLRLMRENNLLSPHRCRRRGGNPHDGEIITHAPNLMWGTDGVRVFTVDDGWGWIFTAVEHWNAECVGWHVCKRGDRFAALQPISMGLAGLYGTRCWGVVPVVHRRDPRCFVSRLRYAERSSVGGSCGPTGSTIAPAVKQVFLGISAVFGFG